MMRGDVSKLLIRFGKINNSLTNINSKKMIMCLERRGSGRGGRGWWRRGRGGNGGFDEPETLSTANVNQERFVRRTRRRGGGGIYSINLLDPIRGQGERSLVSDHRREGGRVRDGRGREWRRAVTCSGADWREGEPFANRSSSCHTLLLHGIHTVHHSSEV